MINVYETRKVPENCSTCLYGRGIGCAHADHQDDWIRYAILDCGCPSYWLDQHRFVRAPDKWPYG